MLLSCDPGVCTGWALSDGTTGTFSVADIPADNGWRLAAYHDWLDVMLTRHRPAHLAIERGFFSRGGATAALTANMIGVAHMLAWAHDVPRREHAASEVRDYLLGGRSLRKGWSDRRLDAAIRDAVEARGFRVESEHAGDAAGLVCLVERREAVAP